MYEASKDGLFRVDKVVGNNPEFEETRRVFATKMAKIHLQKQREQEELMKAASGAPNGSAGFGTHQFPGPPLARSATGTNKVHLGENIAKPPLAASSVDKRKSGSTEGRVYVCGRSRYVCDLQLLRSFDY
uniref:Uncharacterized protein n=1 Tax=Sphaerodactylus townsendi TaxID=933632 RepID=A0ACB8FUR3_9SAUR